MHPYSLVEKVRRLREVEKLSYNAIAVRIYRENGIVLHNATVRTWVCRLARREK